MFLQLSGRKKKIIHSYIIYEESFTRTASTLAEKDLYVSDFFFPVETGW